MVGDRRRAPEGARGVTGRWKAYAKVNLCLFLGPARTDGRHELVTLFESVDLADELEVAALGSGEPDQVVCEVVRGPNLVAEALVALRAAGWSAPPLGVRIHKRIPVAAGMGGGSADAAALLRNAPGLAPVPDGVAREIAIALGADVPSQLEPGASLGTGAGEILEPVDIGSHTVLVLPQPFGLSTAEAFREADRLGLPRPAPELSALRTELRETVSAHADAPAALPAHWIVNDLQPASLSLRPEIGEAIAMAIDAGADQAIVCGSGPTVIGIFWGAGDFDRANAAAKRLRARYPGAVAARPIRPATPAGAGKGSTAQAPND